ncbi:D-aminoacyl-tRNA deacylase [Flavobacteriaceae bacterium]|nr:D-aminoacyl-tRNA deacylase [Flavobacteriaceae bacterium]
MKAIIQRVRSASVVVDGQNIAKIGHGLLVLLGVTHQDTQDDVEWLSKKISQMRIFSDLKGQMNASVQDIDGGLLVVSQFTLMASTNKGNRPSFLDAARPERAMELYERFVKQLSLEAKRRVETGVFGADMAVELINDGPVTIILDSKVKV